MGPSYQRNGKDFQLLFNVTRLLLNVTWLLFDVTQLLLKVTWLLFNVARLPFNVTQLLFILTWLLNVTNYFLLWLPVTLHIEKGTVVTFQSDRVTF